MNWVTRSVSVGLLMSTALVAVDVLPVVADAAPAGCVLGGTGNLGVAGVSQSGSTVGGESCTYVATGPVSYAGAGFWTIDVQHVDGTADSTANGAGAPTNGTLPAAAGDTVTAVVLAPGGSLAVGNPS